MSKIRFAGAIVALLGILLAGCEPSEQATGSNDAERQTPIAAYAAASGRW